MIRSNINETTADSEVQATIPVRFQLIKERVSARDREWFARHPSESHYVRPYGPGELWPSKLPEGIDLIVLVTQVAPGYRLREPIGLVASPQGGRMHIYDPIRKIWLRDVPTDGVGP